MDNKTIIIAQSGQPCAGSGVASREALILDTIKSMHWPGKTMARRAASAVRALFKWMVQTGRSELDKLTLADIREHYISRMCSVSYAKSIRYGMKLAFRCLADSGCVGIDCNAIFSLKVATRNRLLPAMPPEDIAKLLESIDRNTPRGKRDYAFILIGAAFGLRCCDIATLRLGDMDWRSGTISIVQSKTGLPTTLPLLEGVGEALKDYILNAREKCSSDFVFVASDGTGRCIPRGTIQKAFAAYARKAGITRAAGDGLGFHSLRRSVGKRLVLGGVSLPTISQVLGHGSINSAERYINLSEDELRSCALDFTLVGEGGASWK